MDLFSDGYADQLGGENLEKFAYSRFRELLISISEEKLELQQQILDRTIPEWKKDFEQLDDIWVVGIKI